MCGIVGFVNFKQDISDYRNVLVNMNDSLLKRGPDEDGYYIESNVALAHKRLIVIDPSGGKQPMSTFDSNFSIYCYRSKWWQTTYVYI